MTVQFCTTVDGCKDPVICRPFPPTQAGACRRSCAGCAPNVDADRAFATIRPGTCRRAAESAVEAEINRIAATTLTGVQRTGGRHSKSAPRVQNRQSPGPRVRAGCVLHDLQYTCNICDRYRIGDVCEWRVICFVQGHTHRRIIATTRRLKCRCQRVGRIASAGCKGIRRADDVHLSHRRPILDRSIRAVAPAGVHLLPAAGPDVPAALVERDAASPCGTLRAGRSPLSCRDAIVDLHLVDAVVVVDRRDRRELDGRGSRIADAEVICSGRLNLRADGNSAATGWTLRTRSSLWTRSSLRPVWSWRIRSLRPLSSDRSGEARKALRTRRSRRTGQPRPAATEEGIGRRRTRTAARRLKARRHGAVVRHRERPHLGDERERTSGSVKCGGHWWIRGPSGLRMRKEISLGGTSGQPEAPSPIARGLR